MYYRRFLIAVVAINILVGCDSEESKPTKDLTQLEGTWTMTSQVRDGKSVGSYSQIWKAINFDNNEILWIDTIKFGTTTFQFSKYEEGAFTNTITLSSEHVRELYGVWTLTGSDTLKMNPVINTYMTEDTLINGHRYSFQTLIDFDYKIEKLTKSVLELVYDDQKLVFERHPK
jgi:hypothetical protein